MNYTCLYDEHVKLNAQMEEFAGFMMPIQYKGIAEEHKAVRENCGIFDVSHMGQVLITRSKALEYTNKIFTNKIPDKETSRVIYGMLLDEKGFPFDDLFIYKLDNEEILLVVNAANLVVDMLWLRENKKDYKNDVKLINRSGDYGEVALQGPNAYKVFEDYFKYDTSDFKFMHFAKVPFNGEELLVSRSGYTGEDGFEIYGTKENIQKIFKELVYDKGVEPCGLGCRDTLRFEACLPLYGHEMSKSINPFEADMGFGVKMDKDFIGKSALQEYLDKGIKRKVAGLELIDRNIARANYKVYKDDKEIGYITTGYKCPSLNKACALALLDINETNIGNEVVIAIRDKKVRAKVVEKPFYHKNYVR